MKDNDHLIKYICPKCSHEWVLVYDSIIDSDCPTCGTRHISAKECYRVEDIEKFLISRGY